jgi:outer membrane murein-binding lipoprotein Lpp
MVEQFGLAMILSAAVNSLALISGTISFSWIHSQADELSITVVPAAANFGAHSNEVSPPAENKAISAFMSTAVATHNSIF